MATNIPPTRWQPTNGTGEMLNISPLYLVTLAGDQLVTLSGDNLITKDSYFDRIPATIWEEDDSI